MRREWRTSHREEEAQQVARANEHTNPLIDHEDPRFCARGSSLTLGKEARQWTVSHHSESQLCVLNVERLMSVESSLGYRLTKHCRWLTVEKRCLAAALFSTIGPTGDASIADMSGSSRTIPRASSENDYSQSSSRSIAEKMPNKSPEPTPRLGVIRWLFRRAKHSGNLRVVAHL
jgi:hypothetical protein